MIVLRRLLSPALIPFAVLAAACAFALTLPFRMIEPDDDDFFYGMHAFARGRVVMTQEEARELGRIELPDTTRRHSHVARGVRSPRGIIRERSPGHYALLAALHLAGIDRLANILLAIGTVVFVYAFVRNHVDDSGSLPALTCVLLVVNPTFLTMLYRVYMSDFAYFAWATVSLGLYFVARRRRSAALAALAGLTLSLSVFFRNTNAIGFLVIAAYEVASALLRRRELARARRGDATAEHTARTPWTWPVLLIAGIAVGLIPLLWYSYATTGHLLGSGYQYRLGRQSSAYFALWDARAVFSLRHLLLGESRGMMSQGHTLSVGLARVLQGYPLVLLAPAGLLVLRRRRLRPALFLGLWLLFFWGIYLCYRTIRADSFQFMCRKLSPALVPLAIGAAALLVRLPPRARYAVLAATLAVSLGVSAEFFVRYLPAGSEPPMPGGRVPAGRRESPSQIARRAFRCLETGQFREAANMVASIREILATMPAHAPARARETARALAPRAQQMATALERFAEAAAPPTQAERGRLAGELRAIAADLNRSLPPPQAARSRTEPGPPAASKGQRTIDPRDLVRRLHRLVDQAERRGIDASRARQLDEASRRAAADGRWQENRRLLNEAIEVLEEALGPPPSDLTPAPPPPRKRGSRP